MSQTVSTQVDINNFYLFGVFVLFSGSVTGTRTPSYSRTSLSLKLWGCIKRLKCGTSNGVLVVLEIEPVT